MPDPRCAAAITAHSAGYRIDDTRRYDDGRGTVERADGATHGQRHGFAVANGMDDHLSRGHPKAPSAGHIDA